MRVYVLSFKGYDWKHLFKLKSYEWSYLFIQMITLSNIVHSAILFKYEKNWYLAQALMFDGIVVQQTDLQWINKEISENKVDAIEWEIENEEIEALLQNNAIAGNTVHIGDYSFTNLFKCAATSIFGFQFGTKYPRVNKAICSEFVAHCIDYATVNIATPKDINEFVIGDKIIYDD